MEKQNDHMNCSLGGQNGSIILRPVMVLLKTFLSLKDQYTNVSAESVAKRLPVVSFSIGDSAEFLYGDEKDAIEKVILEFRDVFIFGGESKLVYHGISSILPNTAPKALLEETNLRPGRLNLNFRVY